MRDRATVTQLSRYAPFTSWVWSLLRTHYIYACEKGHPVSSHRESNAGVGSDKISHQPFSHSCTAWSDMSCIVADKGGFSATFNWMTFELRPCNSSHPAANNDDQLHLLPWWETFLLYSMLQIMQCQVIDIYGFNAYNYLSELTISLLANNFALYPRYLT